MKRNGLRTILVLVVLLSVAFVVQAASSDMVMTYQYSDYVYEYKHTVYVDSIPAGTRFEIKRVYGTFRLYPESGYSVCGGLVFYDGHSGSSQPNQSETWYFHAQTGCGNYYTAWYAEWRTPPPLVPNCGTTKVEMKSWWTPQGGAEQYIGTITRYIPPCY